MGLLETAAGKPRGLFDNQQIIHTYQALRREAAEGPTREMIRRIERAGPIMVVDPEKAKPDLDNTLERIRIAARMGMEVMELGGSTDKGEAEDVIPKIRGVVREVGADTSLVGFPGTGSQVIEGLDATFSLFLPQLDEVFRSNPKLAQYFIHEYFSVIERGRQLGIPVIPVTYILFNGGVPTTVERTTGINAINVRNGVDIGQVMQTISLWLSENDLVMLELGSGPGSFANLGPVAAEVYKLTHVHPIVTGGVSTPERMSSITNHISTPVVFGSRAEQTLPEEFGALYRDFRQAHPACR